MSLLSLFLTVSSGCCSNSISPASALAERTRASGVTWLHPCPASRQPRDRAVGPAACPPRSPLPTWEGLAWAPGARVT